MKKTTIMLSIILIAIIITGCTTTSNVVKETKQRPIKIGLFAPLTGSAASWGQNVLAGAQLAVNEVNSQGGINGRKVILIAEDDKCSVEGATAVKKLIEYDRVDAIVGSVCSAAAEPAVPIAQQEKIPVVLTIASAPELTINRDYIFRNYPSNNYFGKAIAEYSYNILEKRKAAVLYSQNSYGTSIKDVFVKEFKKAGGEVVFIQGINDNQKDFKTEIAKIKNTDADFLYIPIYPGPSLMLIKQAKENDLDLQIIGGDSVAGEEIVESGYADDLIVAEPAVDNPEEFAQRIHSISEYKDLQLSTPTPIGYDATRIIIEAMKKAGTESEALKNAIAETNYNGVSNKVITFDEQGDLEIARFKFQIVQNNKLVAIN